VTSGRKLTQEQIDAILRLAGLEREDGSWLLTYQQIADRVQVNERTVRRWIRKAAARLGASIGWKADYRV